MKKNTILITLLIVCFSLVCVSCNNNNEKNQTKKDKSQNIDKEEEENTDDGIDINFIKSQCSTDNYIGKINISGLNKLEQDFLDKYFSECDLHRKTMLAGIPPEYQSKLEYYFVSFHELDDYYTFTIISDAGGIVYQYFYLVLINKFEQKITFCEQVAENYTFEGESEIFTFEFTNNVFNINKITQYRESNNLLSYTEEVKYIINNNGQLAEKEKTTDKFIGKKDTLVFEFNFVNKLLIPRLYSRIPYPESATYKNFIQVEENDKFEFILYCDIEGDIYEKEIIFDVNNTFQIISVKYNVFAGFYKEESNSDYQGGELDSDIFSSEWKDLPKTEENRYKIPYWGDIAMPEIPDEITKEIEQKIANNPNLSYDLRTTDLNIQITYSINEDSYTKVLNFYLGCSD